MSLDGDIYVIDVQRGRWEWPALIRVIGETALTDDQQVSQTVETAGVQRGMLDLLMAEPRLAAIPFRGITPIADKITRANPVLARAEQRKVHLLRASWNAAFLDEFCAFPEADHDDQVDAVSGAFQAISMSNRGSGMNGAEQVEDYESPWR
jgi:predicted phage terminase large subunit-like protein